VRINAHVDQYLKLKYWIAYIICAIGDQRDRIAARQARRLNDHLPPKSKRMTPREVGEVFMLMKGRY
jgi:hypothetical protein